MKDEKDRLDAVCLGGFAVALAVAFAGAAVADVVDVYEETACGASVQRVADRMLETGRSYRTAKPPAKSGWIFTHWTISTDQDFENRDVWGRAYDEAPFKLYEETTLTAHYLPTGTDTDNDGAADGYEIYWYGDLSQNAASDTDGDGFTFAQELANGTNPLLADGDIEGPVKYADSQLHEANLQPYEKVTGAVVDEIYEEFPTFGGAVTPTIVDVDGDGVEDLLVSDAEGRIWFYLSAPRGEDASGTVEWSFLSLPSFESRGDEAKMVDNADKVRRPYKRPM